MSSESVSQRSQAFAIGDRAAVCRQMRFVVQIQREILGVLRLDDLDVFGEDLVTLSSFKSRSGAVHPTWS
jgi:hypothetical protein